MLLSPLGERLGEGVLQETIFGLPPHLTSPPRGERNMREKIMNMSAPGVARAQR
jgi:hypothetical protein